MTIKCLQSSTVVYRNFNLCPHCISHGQQALLCRLCEGIPMISRSDGESFHLLLADRPLPYPLEQGYAARRRVSVCFWYSHVSQPNSTLSTIVVLPDSRTNHPAVFRMIEAAADLLAEELVASGTLSAFYEFCEEAAQAAAS